jgi:uncharacterized protein
MNTVASLASPALAEYCRTHSISRLRVFGSFARGEATSGSDLDLIADFASPVSLFDIVRIEDQLSELLGMRVDLLTEDGISPYIKPRIANDVQVVYEAG